MAKAHPNSIASVVGGRKELDGKLCIDAIGRTWEIWQNHSGCFLNGKNVEAHIPYWTCYFISLPKLRITSENNYSFELFPKPSLLEELLRLSVKKGDLIQDSKFGLLWIVRLSEYGLSLEGYDDNHWIPQNTLSVLSFGNLKRLSTQAQRDARKLERLL